MPEHLHAWHPGELGSADLWNHSSVDPLNEFNLAIQTFWRALLCVSALGRVGTVGRCMLWCTYRRLAQISRSRILFTS